MSRAQGRGTPRGAGASTWDCCDSGLVRYSGGSSAVEAFPSAFLQVTGGWGWRAPAPSPPSPPGFRLGLPSHTHMTTTRHRKAGPTKQPCCPRASGPRLVTWPQPQPPPRSKVQTPSGPGCGSLQQREATTAPRGQRHHRHWDPQAAWASGPAALPESRQETEPYGGRVLPRRLHHARQEPENAWVGEPRAEPEAGGPPGRWGAQWGSLVQLLEAGLAHAHLLLDAKLGDGGGPGGALAAEDLAARPAVVL